MKKIIMAVWMTAGILTLNGYAAVSGPYTVDAYTLHLWHFDGDYYGSLQDEVLTDPIDLWYIWDANVIDASYPGFGDVLTTYDGVLSNMSPLAFYTDYPNGRPIDDFMDPVTGAFTFEAIVKPLMAAGTLPNPMEIICADTAQTGHSRGWQFRIEQSGTTLRFQQLTGAVVAYDAAISYTVGTWYHAAVTYNGNLGEADNIKLYWTQLDSDAGQAQLAGTGTMSTSMLTANNVEFTIGNELRSTGGYSENFEGLIDEVRISSIAREPNDMLIVPGPSAPVIVSDPVDAAVHETQTAAFTTVFTSQSTPSVTWYKIASPTDLAMDPADVETLYDSQTEQYTSTLTLTALTMSDVGQYYCQIVNDSGYPKNSTAASLMVYGLVAHWTLDQDDFAGGRFLDIVGGYDAAAAGTPVFVNGADGTAGGAVQIASASGWAQVDPFDLSLGSGVLTISIWANWQEGTIPSQALAMTAYPEDDTLTVEDGLQADGQWQHLCVVYGSTVAKIYIDGILAAEGPWSLPTDTTAALTLGSAEGGAESFDGFLDDLRIYNYPMTNTDVADLFYEVTGRCVCILPIDAQYDFTGPEGSPDCSINILDLIELTDYYLTSDSAHDLTGPTGQPDGIIDLHEFAGLAGAWLSCGLYPDCP